MSDVGFSVQNRPKRPELVGAAVYGFLITTSVTGAVVFGIIADRARVWRNARKLAR